MNVLRTFALSTLFAATAFAGDQPDPATLYEVTTEGSTAKVAQGGEAKLKISILAKKNAHVSDEAPLKIELSGTNATPSKAKLTLKDSVAKKVEGEKYPNPVFEIPYTLTAAGKATMDAKATFYICTDTLCVKQVKNLSVPVEVTAAKKSM